MKTWIRGLFAAIAFVVVIVGVNSANAAAGAMAKPVAKFIVKSIASGLAWDAIKKAASVKFPDMTPADLDAAMAEGMRLYEQARTDPNPSTRDCMWDVYAALNPKCEDALAY